MYTDELMLVAGGSDGNGDEFGTANRDKATEKACLERYRRASVEIIGLLHRSASKVMLSILTLASCFGPAGVTSSLVLLLKYLVDKAVTQLSSS